MQSWLANLATFLRRVRIRILGEAHEGTKDAASPSDSSAGSVNARAGAAGERAAEAHLRASGLRILARNWRNPADQREEIDLVCEELPPAGRANDTMRGREEAVLVFVEVKARAAGSRVSGYHAVDRRKKALLLRAFRAYLALLRPPPRHLRFDIVEVAHGSDPAAAAAVRTMQLDPRSTSLRDGRRVWHYRDVPLFPNRANHRHD
ncbi:MAG: hypothetical protein EAZ36_05420 [Verrucomicrobia bacterium]|nr:MAG: hypothetical protein EAZ36_05420 [Verrucomicrobiota bacterium]